MLVRRLTVAALAAFVCLGAQAARAADPDLSSPKSAAVALAKAISEGDSATIRAVSVGTDEEMKTAEAMGTMLSSILKFVKAVETKFGKDNVLSQGFAGQKMDLVAEVEKSEVKIDGDTATVISPDKKEDPHPMKLKKVDGKWKADLSSMGPEAKAMVTGPGATMAKIFAEAAKEIEDGKYKTAEEAAVAIGQKMQAAQPK